MEKCHRCGAETDYYNVALPTCLKCARALDAKPEPIRDAPRVEQLERPKRFT
jgi:hypothetical protein